MSVPPDDRATARSADIARAVAEVRDRIASAARRADRDPGGVRLIAVTKTHPVADVLAAVQAGVSDFGENRAVDLASKASSVALLGPGRPRWHFLGKLQSGTVRHVADVADVVHSAEPGGAMGRLARRVAAAGRAIDVLIEVDQTGVRQGAAPDAVLRFADELVVMPNIRLVGLMTIPPVTPSAEGARPFFRELMALASRLQRAHPEARELSMGMSVDYEVAVEEGATMVRVGTALFGQRLPGA
jgi:PLP dependent protein